MFIGSFFSQNREDNIVMEVSILQEGLVVVVRSLIAFFTLFIFARVLGRQQISQLTFFDYVLGITIGSTAASLSSDLSTRAWAHWVALLVWVIAVLVLQLVSIRWRSLSKYIEGEPVVVIMNGKIMEKAMGTIRYRIADLLEQLREKDVFDLGQVEFAVLETNGQLSVLKKSQYQPVTPKDLNLSTHYSGVSTELIYSGVIVQENLQQVKLDQSWLEAELRKKGINDLKEVFFAALDTEGNLYVDTYKDHLSNLTDTSNDKGANNRRE